MTHDQRAPKKKSQRSALSGLLAITLFLITYVSSQLQNKEEISFLLVIASLESFLFDVRPIKP